ncbi:sensor histidine kinase [Alkalicoccus daliensis]|uniref:histidine kinase n=1 Tax=Alkalicoccus daliensis TaxID=745820 RepID=A0A1G9ZCQ4_9BACI|nr:ATP-binding protein [Alkalicoccus daliensis]SDN19054.1 two-component system, OmpR family, sensor histidine kinase CiaH [Alkalicoccus daliensis]
MNNKPIFRRQQLRFMILNLLAFTIIFTIFGIIIFTQVQNTLYSETDNELRELREILTRENETEGIFAPRILPASPVEERTRANLNPRIIMLNWNENGDNINADQIGLLLYQNYFQDYEVDLDNLNTISTMTIPGGYSFRYLLFEDSSIFGETYYTQLLVNVDAEQTIISNFGRLIVLFSFLFILLSISASYYLSKKMMGPIVQSWNKQTEFVENASHELRTPLTVIQNKLELMLTSPQEKIMNKFEHIALSLSETRRLSKLTSDLLTLARADSAETQLEKKDIEIDSFIEKVSLPYQEIAESQEKAFQMELQSQLIIKADEVRLHQLLVILLDNALKYTEEGDRILLKSYRSSHDLIIDVIDSGQGIKEENLHLVFERFYREDKARSRETGGTGLGLSIARWIIHAHAGTITAFRNDPKGTVFRVTLPAEGK